MTTGRMTMCRTTLRLSAVALLVLGFADFAASATQRKPRHAPPAPTSRDVETEPTGTIATRPSNSPATATKPDDDVLPPPFHLPTASRVRMRECGLKWQTMKMSGEAGDDIWRDFATRCLAAANGPLEKR